jgi:Protein of unknown function (DUF3592)
MAFRILDLAARLLLALGVGCLLLAGYLSWHTLAFSPGTASATGEVVSYREIPDGEDTRYRPRIRFKTVTGEIVTVEGQFFTGAQRFAVGTQIPMLYKVEKPNEARVALFVDNWLGPCVAVLVGLTGIAGGWLVRRSIRRELAKSRA